MSGLSAETRHLLARAGLAPRKRLGQHFLVDRAVVARMIDLAEIGPREAVLEIGPGLGALTTELAARAARLYVIEYDHGLCQVLQRKFADAPHVRVIAGDALRIDLRGAIPEGTVKVVASLPYNVAVPILFRLLEERLIFSDLTVMLQREIAERVIAAPGTPAYGAPSLLLQLHAEVLGRFRVPPSAFYPRPRVTSEVLRLRLTPEPRVPLANARVFRAVVRAAFNQRRKMLRNAVRALPPRLTLPPPVWETVFTAAGVDARARGETLDVRAFATLADAAAAALAARGEVRSGDAASAGRHVPARGRGRVRHRPP